MTRTEAINKMEELTGLDIINGHIRGIYSDNTEMTFGVFENEMISDHDFFFIPVVREKPIELFHNRYEVWVLSHATMVKAFKDPNARVKTPSDGRGNWKKWIFDIKEAKRVYPVKKLTLEPAPVIPADKLTVRDKVCIELKIPKADTPWVNDLIEEANKRQLLKLSMLND